MKMFAKFFFCYSLKKMIFSPLSLPSPLFVRRVCCCCCCVTFLEMMSRVEASSTKSKQASVNRGKMCYKKIFHAFLIALHVAEIASFLLFPFYVDDIERPARPLSVVSTSAFAHVHCMMRTQLFF